MGCDIHLKLERRYRNPKNDYEKSWRPCRIIDRPWSDRIYGMFAVLANVRNYAEEPANLIPLRGFPDDASWETFYEYTLNVVPDDKFNEDYDGEFRITNETRAKRWLDGGLSMYMNCLGRTSNNAYITDPDFHSPNWCTTEEMEMCIKKVFYDEEKKEWHGDYLEWKVLLALMKEYENTNTFEIRAVFWFDS